MDKEFRFWATIDLLDRILARSLNYKVVPTSDFRILFQQLEALLFRSDVLDFMTEKQRRRMSLRIVALKPSLSNPVLWRKQLRQLLVLLKKTWRRRPEASIKFTPVAGP